MSICSKRCRMRLNPPSVLSPLVAELSKASAFCAARPVKAVVLGRVNNAQQAHLYIPAAVLLWGTCYVFYLKNYTLLQRQISSKLEVLLHFYCQLTNSDLRTMATNQRHWKAPPT